MVRYREKKKRRMVEAATSHYMAFDILREQVLDRELSGPVPYRQFVAGEGADLLSLFDECRQSDGLHQAALSAVEAERMMQCRYGFGRYEEHGIGDVMMWRARWSRSYDKALSELRANEIGRSKSVVLFAIAHAMRMPTNRPGVNRALQFLRLPGSAAVKICVRIAEQYETLVEDASNWPEPSPGHGVIVW